jgi:signal transduction histidine kinase
MRFQHRLHGLEESYMDAASTRTAYYSYLRPGDYVFHVKACNNDGVWNEEGATLALTLRPHYWQSVWFSLGIAVLAATAVAVAVAAASRARHRQKLQVLERQRAVERERVRISQDIHDDLGSNLTRISLLSESAMGKLDGTVSTAAADIEHIRRTAHDLTCALDEIVWAVNPRHDTMNGLVNYLTHYAEETMQTAGIRLSLDLPLSIPDRLLGVETRHSLFLVVKEALNNVVKHARATKVRLGIELNPGEFVVEVKDDGCGFAGGVQGHGLWSMDKRLKDIGGLFKVEGVPGHGTTVRLSVPLEDPGVGRQPGPDGMAIPKRPARPEADA